MTTTMANRVSDQEGPTPEQVRRGRRTALLLFALGFGPMIVATIMFYTGWLNPVGHSNKGTLIQPPVPVQSLNLEAASGKPLADRFGPDKAQAQWMLMVVANDCDSRCEQLLYLTRQVNIALGKNANRVSRAAALARVPADLQARWSEEYRLMERLAPMGGGSSAWPEAIDPKAEPSILLVDPFGNVMMRYGTDHTGKEMLKDLKHLLKLSQIG